jgi:hypothetical protein
MRQLFQINTDTGSQGDTGPMFSGEISQIKWYPTTADTGADLLIQLRQRADDTGDSIVVFNKADCLGAGFTQQPVCPQVTNDGDSGNAIYAPYYSNNERIRVKVTPGGAACVGRLYVWTSDDI